MVLPGFGFLGALEGKKDFPGFHGGKTFQSNFSLGIGALVGGIRTGRKGILGKQVFAEGTEGLENWNYFFTLRVNGKFTFKFLTEFL